MGRDRVHAHGGIAQQCAAVARKALGIHGHQRVSVPLAHQRHGPQPVVELGLHLGGKGFGALGHQCRCIGRARRDHHRAQRMPRLWVIGQGQHGQRAVVAKTFVRHVAMGLGVAHAADDDGAAKVAHLCANAQLAARGRIAAVGGHQQRGRQALGWGASGTSRHIVQLCMPGQRGCARDLGLGDQLHPRRARRHGIGGAAQRMVGHDEAQRAGCCTLRGLRGAQLQRAVLAQRAVVYLGFADGAHFMPGQQAPAAQALQCVAAGVGQRDLTAVWRGRRQRAVALLLDHRGGEPGLRQGGGQRQARRACADDEYVAVVGGHGGRNAG